MHCHTVVILSHLQLVTLVKQAASLKALRVGNRAPWLLTMALATLARPTARTCWKLRTSSPVDPARARRSPVYSKYSIHIIRSLEAARAGGLLELLFSSCGSSKMNICFMTNRRFVVRPYLSGTGPAKIS